MSLDISSEHQRYLEELGITPSAPKTVKGSPPRKGGKVLGIFNESDLARILGHVSWRFHDDEEREGLTVLVRRRGFTVGRIDCANVALAWDAERICAGIRFKRGG